MYLKMLCDQMDEIEVVKAFMDPEEFLVDQSFLSYDFCIMDIEMPKMTGLELAKQLNGKPIIFSTAYSEYAADAFDLNAIDYLRKPIQPDRLKQAVVKMVQYLDLGGALPLKHQATFNTDKGKSILAFDRIAYIGTSKIDSRDKIAVLNSGDEFVLKNISFSELLRLLPSRQFSRINKQEIIAYSFVESFTHQEVNLLNFSPKNKKYRFQLSENYKREFLSHFKS
jgi:DNA-binding LytR/AlgR family response regulator